MTGTLAAGVLLSAVRGRIRIRPRLAAGVLLSAVRGRIRIRPRLAAALALTASAAPALAQTAASAPDLSSARVGRVHFQRTNVFDPAVKGEDWWAFRVANKIHFITREPVVARELLFGPGDPWDPLKALESERNLRANGSFRRAEIVPVATATGVADVLVRTQDSWTTNVNLAAGTEGGENFFGLGFEEGNILGYGKSVSFDYGQNGRRRDNAFGYRDPRFLGTRLSLDTDYVRGSNGDSTAASLTRPFYALESYRAQHLSWSRSLGDATLYRNGEEFSKYRSRRRRVEASAGARLNADRLFVQRMEAGWYSDRFQFLPLPETAPGSLPGDRELSGPTLGYSWVQPRYVKETYIDRMERVEDFNLGNELSFRGGWMGRATGSDRDRAIYAVGQQQGLALGAGRFVIGRVGAGGRVAGGRAENVLLTAGLSGFWKTLWRGNQTLVAHLEGAAGRFLDYEHQVVLGGNTGLRGYKNNSFIGGKAVLLNLEDRFFIDREWLHLARVGGAVFVDTGAVVPEGANPTWRSFKSDIGAGLRLASTRSRSGGVVRFDLAYALDRGPGGSRWVLSIRAGQAFNLFNSAAQRIEPAPASRLY